MDAPEDMAIIEADMDSALPPTEKESLKHVRKTIRKIERSTNMKVSREYKMNIKEMREEAKHHPNTGIVEWLEGELAKGKVCVQVDK